MRSPEASAPAVGAKRVAITGATGYVGGRLARRFLAEGWQVVRLGRTARRTDEEIPFRLGEDVDPEVLAGCTTLVHCAYDFAVSSPDAIHEVNVRGSERLLRAARDAGVERLIFISSVSAFEGCRSLYGQAKLRVEELVHSLGGWVIRPGLVWGENPGGLFGRLRQTVAWAPVVPIPAGGSLYQYLVHDADLGAAVWRCAASETAPNGIPVTVAHPRPWSLTQLVREVGRSLQKTRLVVPVPWQLVWLGLSTGEVLRLTTRFRADNLVSFVHQNPNPVFNAFDTLGVRCREFDMDRHIVSAEAYQRGAPS
jgi:nucleoside-diphosphate-sugar epimerase